MRERGQRLAEAGYSSLIWNPYPGEPLPAGPAVGAGARAPSSTTARSTTMSDCVGYMLDTHEAAGGGGDGLLPRRPLCRCCSARATSGCSPACRIYPVDPRAEPAAPDARCGRACRPSIAVSGASDPCRRRPGVQAGGVRSGSATALERRAGRDHRADPSGRGAQLHAAGPAQACRPMPRPPACPGRRSVAFLDTCLAQRAA